MTARTTAEQVAADAVAAWRALPPAGKLRFKERLAGKLAANRARQRSWLTDRRPPQCPPPASGDWLIWLILAGRGWGKTRTGAETAADWAREHPGCRIALVAQTFADGRDVMVEGESGLLAVLDEAELRGGSLEKAWNRSMGELYLANGSRFKVYSSEKPRQLRGPQHHFAWGDELASWNDAVSGTAKDTTFSNLMFGLRLMAPVGSDWPAEYQPRMVATTTPKPVALLKVSASVVAREPHRAGLLQRDTTVVTTGRTADNLGNLSASFRRTVVDPLLGTTLGRQELDAELIEDLEGAYLSRPVIERGRMSLAEIPHLLATVVAVDPATTVGENSDETGITASGMDAQHQGYLLDDITMKAAPDVWGIAVWDLVWEHGADAIVIEDNQGGDMCQHVLTTTYVDAKRKRQRLGLPSPVVPIVRVHPSGRREGKWIRAQALQPSWEQARIHVVDDPAKPGRLDAFIDQACTWTGDPDEDSPDHIDSAVHGLTWLMFPRQRSGKDTNAGQGSRWGSGSGRR